MDIQKFNNQQLHKKAYFIDKFASFICNLFIEDIIYSLYSQGNVYFEVAIHNSTKHLLDIKAFKAKFNKWDLLDKYLEHIEINELKTN